MTAYEKKRKELRDAAYNFRATVRLNLHSARERQLAVERIDEGLLWAMRGVALDEDIHPARHQSLDPDGRSGRS